MIPACGNERGLAAIALRQFEPEHAAIEIERAFEIGDLEMDVPDPGAGGDGHRCVGHGARLQEGGASSSIG
jgi:hypothetical protein